MCICVSVYVCVYMCICHMCICVNVSICICVCVCVRQVRTQLGVVRTVMTASASMRFACVCTLQSHCVLESWVAKRMVMVA